MFLSQGAHDHDDDDAVVFDYNANTTAPLPALPTILPDDEIKDDLFFKPKTKTNI